jgi:hypothetical protein
MKNDICNAILMAILMMAMVLSGCVMNLGGSLAISNRSNADIATADTDGRANSTPDGAHSVNADKTTEASAAVNTSSGQADARKSQEAKAVETGKGDPEAPAEAGGDVK